MATGTCSRLTSLATNTLGMTRTEVILGTRLRVTNTGVIRWCLVTFKDDFHQIRRLMKEQCNKKVASSVFDGKLIAIRGVTNKQKHVISAE